MNTSLRTLALVSATAVVTAAATTILPITARDTGAQNANAATALPAEPPATPLVTGLPDFTRLVDRVGPAVVNIEAAIKPETRMRGRSGATPNDEEIPEFFKRFFGPDTPFPGGPQQGGSQQGGSQQGIPELPEGGPRGVSQGSGFLISADGYVLTNHHVVDGADEVTVKLTDRRSFKAKVIGSDEQSDVAVLKIASTGLPYLRVGNSKSLKPGQWVVAIGSPFGLDHSVTAGIVSAVGRANPYADQRYVPFIQTDVAINRGNSGGPLLNTSGEVVGINSQIFSNSGGYMGVSFAIPMNVAMNVSDQLRKTGLVERGQLGVQVESIDSQEADALRLPDNRGALVSNVIAGSPAERAGLEPGDVIRAVDGVVIDDYSDLPPMIGVKPFGSAVNLKIFRSGKTIERSVTLTRINEGGVAISSQRHTTVEPKTSAADNPFGLIGQDIEPDRRRELGLRAGEGVMIARVDTSKVRSADLRPGDIVLRVGTTPVGNAASLGRELNRLDADKPVMLLIRRGASTQFRVISQDS
jgi:serine protease Do